MGKGIKKEARAQGLEPVSLSELIHQHVRAVIETAVHEELRAALGTSPYERRDVRRGYRNGVRERTLTGPPGPGRAHVASGDPLQRCRRRERMDVETRPALGDRPKPAKRLQRHGSVNLVVIGLSRFILVTVMTEIPLITQGSLVQIQPPQPT